MSFLFKRPQLTCSVPDVVARRWQSILASAGWIVLSPRANRTATRYTARLKRGPNFVVDTRIRIKLDCDTVSRDQGHWEVRVGCYSAAVIRLFLSCGGKLEPSLAPRVCQALYRCVLNDSLFNVLDMQADIVWPDTERPEIGEFCDRHFSANPETRRAILLSKNAEHDWVYIGYSDLAGYYIAFCTGFSDWTNSPQTEEIRRSLDRISCEQLQFSS